MERRQFIKRASASGVALSVPGIAGAQQTNETGRSFDDVYNQARKIRKRTSDHNKFVQYLRNHGANVSTVRNEYRVPSQAPKGGMSTQAFERDELVLDITMTVYHDCETVDYYADLYWTWDADFGDGEGDGSGGEPSRDLPRVSWNNDHFDYLSNYTSDSRTSYYNAGGNFCAWKFEDDGVSGDPPYDASAGVKIDPLKTDQTRRIYGKYTHTYQETEVCGASAANDGTWSISYCLNDKKWHSDLVDVTYSERNHDGPCSPT